MIFEDAEVKKILIALLDEIFAIDGEIRLEPNSVYNPAKRRKIKISALRKTCKQFEIPYCDMDLQEIKLETLPEFIKNV